MDAATKKCRFETLVMPHLDAAFNFARWLTRNQSDAEDVMQEAFLRTMRFFDGFSGEDGKAWILVVVRNTHLTLLKRNRSECYEQFDGELHALIDGPSLTGAGLGHANPETHLMQRDGWRLVNVALQRLPADVRDAIILRELEDLSYKQIAQITQVPLGTVMSGLHRARRLLREQLVKIR